MWVLYLEKHANPELVPTMRTRVMGPRPSRAMAAPYAAKHPLTAPIGSHSGTSRSIRCRLMVRRVTEGYCQAGWGSRFDHCQVTVTTNPTNHQIILAWSATWKSARNRASSQPTCDILWPSADGNPRLQNPWSTNHLELHHAFDQSRIFGSPQQSRCRPATHHKPTMVLVQHGKAIKAKGYKFDWICLMMYYDNW